MAGRKRRLKAELVREKYHTKHADCIIWYDTINEEIFDGSLLNVSIVIRRLRGTWGSYQNNTIELTNWFPSKEIFLNVLAHEMIHVYQAQNEQPLGHGPSFWKWKKKFKSNGLFLSEKYYGRPYIVQ